MNRITATLAATIAVIGFSACTAQQRQMVDNVIEDEAPATTYVVDIGTPLAPVLNPNAPCGETGGGDCYQPPTPARPCGETGGPDCAQLPTPTPTTSIPLCGETNGPECDQLQP